MRNRQIHNDTGIPLLRDWITIQFNPIQLQSKKLSRKF